MCAVVHKAASCSVLQCEEILELNIIIIRILQLVTQPWACIVQWQCCFAELLSAQLSLDDCQAQVAAFV